MAAVPSDYLAAARKYGPELDNVAAKYRNPVTGRALSGAALLLKLAKGESGFNMGAVSGAGARGGTQFMPDTRTAVLNKTGGHVDPWRSVDEAMHAAVLHLTGKLGNNPGLEGYNPGDPSYTGYILGQKVGSTGAGKGSTASPGTQPLTSGSNRQTTTTTTQLPSGGQVDLAGLLDRITPQSKPQPIGVAAPAFAAGQQYAGGLSPVGVAGKQDQSAQLADILASSNPGPSSVTNTSSRTTPGESGSVSSKTGGRRMKGGSPLFELFYNGPGGINAKNGQREPRGFVTGHTDHVHVAAGPITVRRLGRLAQQMGLNVGENPSFGGVHPVHVQGSYHYKKEAIDVSGDPRKMRAYNRRVASLYGLS